MSASIHLGLSSDSEALFIPPLNTLQLDLLIIEIPDIAFLSLCRPFLEYF